MKQIEEYGKFEDGKFEYCPNPLKTGVGEYGDIYTANPDEDTILKAGYQKIEKEEKPDGKDGGIWVEDEPVEIDGKIYVSWRFIETPVTIYDYDQAMEDHNEFKFLWKEVPEKDKMQISNGVRGRSVNEGMQMENITIDDWLKHVSELA